MRPADTEAERLALATALVYPDTLDDLMTLAEVDFDSQQTRKLFRVICEMGREANEIDWVEFSQRSGLKQSDVVRLTALAVSGAMMPGLVKKLRDLSRRRAMIEAGTMLQQRAQDMSTETDALLAEAAGRIEDATLNTTTEPELIIDVVERRMDNLVAGQGTQGIPTGLIDLDEVWSGFFPGEITILAARPSMGKTALAQFMAQNVAEKTNMPVLFFSLEMANEYLVDRYISTTINSSVDTLRRGQVAKKYLEGQFDRVLKHFAALKIYLQDQSKITTQEIQAQARKIQKREGLSLVVVDYLTLIADDKERGESEHLKVQAITRRLRTIAKTLKVPVMVLAQLNRGLENRQNKRPQMSDLRESGGIEEAADNVLFIYRDKYYNPDNGDERTEIIIGKQKQGPRGFTAYVDYQPDKGLWRNTAKGSHNVPGR